MRISAPTSRLNGSREGLGVDAQRLLVDLAVDRRRALADAAWVDADDVEVLVERGPGGRPSASKVRRRAARPAEVEEQRADPVRWSVAGDLATKTSSCGPVPRAAVARAAPWRSRTARCLRHRSSSSRAAGPGRRSPTPPRRRTSAPAPRFPQKDDRSVALRSCSPEVDSPEQSLPHGERGDRCQAGSTSASARRPITPGTGAARGRGTKSLLELTFAERAAPAVGVAHDDASVVPLEHANRALATCPTPRRIPQPRLHFRLARPTV